MTGKQPLTSIRRWVLSAGALVIGLALSAACTSSADDDDTATNAQPTTTVGEETTATPATPATPVETTILDVETTTSTTAATESSTESTEPAGSGANAGCEVAPVPASAGLDSFYTQGCQVDGFWVVANEVVDPTAVTQAAETVERIFATDERLAPTLAETGVRLGIIGRNQRTTEMPEYRDLNEVFPETDWDTRARGLGATLERPLVSAGEENVLCLASDRYLGEDILLHEFSHVLHEFGYGAIDPGFDAELLAAYEQAIEQGTWDDTYAATNYFEYWAEGVQSYVGRNLTSEPADGIHGPIDTRAELESADPALFDLIDQRLGNVDLPPQCR